MAKTSAAIKKIADAGAPLYQSLSDAQKHRFIRLSHMLKPHHHMPMHARNDGGPGGWGQGQSPGFDGGDGRPHWPGYQGRRFGESDPGPAPSMQQMMGTGEANSDL
jgi:hypothetical protein